MKRLIVPILVLTLMLCGCSAPVVEDQTATPEEIYRHFISGQEADGEYAVYDMNGDAVTELLVRTDRGISIYWIVNDTVTLWHSNTTYTKPLNNSALLAERPGGAPEHTDYIYQVLGYQGEELFKIEFSEYAPTEFQGVQHDSVYLINGIEVSKAVYDSITETLLSIGDNKIEWKTLEN